jgi:hypothetical protein
MSTTARSGRSRSATGPSRACSGTFLEIESVHDAPESRRAYRASSSVRTDHLDTFHRRATSHPVLFHSGHLFLFRLRSPCTAQRWRSHPQPVLPMSLSGAFCSAADPTSLAEQVQVEGSHISIVVPLDDASDGEKGKLFKKSRHVRACGHAQHPALSRHSRRQPCDLAPRGSHRFRSLFDSTISDVVDILPCYVGADVPLRMSTARD